MKVSVSYLKSQYTKEETIDRIENTSADFLHVDLMDGKFVLNKNFILEEVISLLQNRKKPLDIHLMTEDVTEYIDKLSSLHPTMITFHIESHSDITKCIEKAKKYGMKVGLSLKPSTPIEELIPYLENIDLVLLMSVEPGRGGQSFLDESIMRLQELKKLKNEKIMISVDGGINDQTILQVKPYVDIVVSGSFICEAENYEAQIEKLR